MPTPADGLIIVAKRDCPTCTMLEPVYAALAKADAGLTIYSQDDPSFPESVLAVDDRDLEISYRFAIETVPTLIRVKKGEEIGRAMGWNRGEWETLTGQDGLGNGLPENQPGCGSKSVDPGIPEVLAVRFGDTPLEARQVEVGAMDDEIEACFQRGWSDGLPVVPPTPVRVLRMLKGTTRDPQEIVGEIPPNLAHCTVEKVAINAVMAGCKPEYLPVVLAAVEAALDPKFAMHGVLCTTHFVGPIVVVNGPITKRIGMNSGVNALGQGNRANSTIGRALQLVIRNVGGGRPGEIDRSTIGNPGKVGLCFAEDERKSIWKPFSEERGMAAGASAVTLYAGEGLMGNFDQLSRTPESLTRSLAMSIKAIGHPKRAPGHDVMIVMGHEHFCVYERAGWARSKTMQEFEKALTLQADDLLRGVDGVAEGLPERMAGKTVNKVRPGGLNIVRAGGEAGLMSALIGCWAASGERGSDLVTKEIGT
ncbi:MAG: thiol reductase thioredoxin [Rickettsiales bacterium]|nr:thiol reductase thioredoxin [Rickettsiales bacterium]